MHVHEGPGMFLHMWPRSGQTNPVVSLERESVWQRCLANLKKKEKTLHEFISSQMFMGDRTCSLVLPQLHVKVKKAPFFFSTLHI